MDVVLLSRLQFALTVMFHYIYPPLSIGLGLILIVSEGLYLWTKDAAYERLTKFLIKIFAVNFAIGVATGLVMEFEFGTNWATYSRFVGDVFGSALAAEGIFAFFLESGFLAVLVFGWNRVSPPVHFFSTIMVAFGSTFSAVWIVIANSWQQTPAGYHIVGEGLRARAEITDFWAMVFNPSAPHRLGHVILGSYLQASFFVLSISAYYLLRKRHLDVAQKAMKIALTLAVVSALAILLSGHEQARMVAVHQPAKLAAFEGHFKQTGGGAPLYLFGVPNPTTESVTGVAIPGMLSFLVHDDFSKPVTALSEIKPEHRPPIQIPFQAYHVMVAAGFYMIGLSVFGLFAWWRGFLFTHPLLLRAFVFSVPIPIIANETGWIAAEVGRQPWVVYGLLRTTDAVSKAVKAEQVLSSIILFALVYSGLFALWLFVLNEKIQHGPDEPEASDTDDGDHDNHGPESLLDAAGHRAGLTHS